MAVTVRVVAKRLKVPILLKRYQRVSKHHSFVVALYARRMSPRSGLVSNAGGQEGCGNLTLDTVPWLTFASFLGSLCES